VLIKNYIQLDVIVIKYFSSKKNIILIFAKMVEENNRSDNFSMKIGKLSQIKAKVLDIAGNSTSHGIPNIVKSNSTFFKLLWLICFLISTGGCAYLVYRNVSNYFEFEVVTKITVVPQSQTDFFAVSFCNKNFVQNSASLELAYREQKQMNDTTYWIVYDYFSWHLSSSINNNPNVTDKEKRSYGSTYDQFVLKCQYAGQPCDKNEIEWYFFILIKY
jgi:pantothenate kinase